MKLSPSARAALRRYEQRVMRCSRLPGVDRGYELARARVLFMRHFLRAPDSMQDALDAFRNALLGYAGAEPVDVCRLKVATTIADFVACMEAR